jgi:RNA polymerase sigma-70 factor (ECF subfamily)
MRDDETTVIGALVHRAVDGDEQATHDLLAHVHPLALRYCRTRLSRLPGDARHFVEDLAQEVCVAVLLALPRYKDTGRPFEAFVFAIAGHKVADLQRAAMRHPGSTAVPSDEMPERPDDSLGPEERSAATPSGPRNSWPTCPRTSGSCCCCGSPSGSRPRRRDRCSACRPARSGWRSTGR